MTDTPAFAPRFECAFALLNASVEAGRIPGGVLGVIDRDGGRMVRATGYAQRVPYEREMRTDTWFDLASLTKVIFTTTRILELAKEGVIDLDAPLTTLLPDLRQYDPGAWERQVTFRQCLGHQLEGKRLRAFDPGPGFAFAADPEKTAATEDCTWRHRVLCGEVHDDNCSALEGAGHAGLFGTADAVLDFAAGLFAGDADGDETVALMRTPLSEKRTHGWERPYDNWPGGDPSHQPHTSDPAFRQRHRCAATGGRRLHERRIGTHMAEGFEPVWAVGLMTGTVLDGNIDVALLKTDGERIEAFGAYTLAPYPQSTRDLLEETLQQARAWNFEGDEPAIFAEAEEVLTRAQAYAVRELVESHGLTMADIGAVGFHGQTVLHRAPQEGRLGETRQLGDGDLMHSILGCPKS